ncbi:hypothetical protein C8R45DRAFT_1219848 [Mycena sanguinolenta]|nr:hypothetical protein C8R45DRAFT_1219848 [Mycena sanguinolenta]
MEIRIVLHSLFFFSVCFQDAVYGNPEHRPQSSRQAHGRMSSLLRLRVPLVTEEGNGLCLADTRGLAVCSPVVPQCAESACFDIVTCGVEANGACIPGSPSPCLAMQWRLPSMARLSYNVAWLALCLRRELRPPCTPSSAVLNGDSQRVRCVEGNDRDPSSGRHVATYSCFARAARTQAMNVPRSCGSAAQGTQCCMQGSWSLSLSPPSLTAQKGDDTR